MLSCNNIITTQNVWVKKEKLFSLSVNNFLPTSQKTQTQVLFSHFLIPLTVMQH